MIRIRSAAARAKLSELIDDDMRQFLVAAAKEFGRAEEIEIEQPELERELTEWRESLGREAIEAMRQELKE